MNVLQLIKRRTPLGWRQLIHDKPRLLTAIAGIAFADILIFMQLGFQGGLFDRNTALPKQLNADIILMSIEGRNLNNAYTFPRGRLFQALDVPGVAAAQGLYVNNVKWRNPQTRELTSLLLLGQDPDQSALRLEAVEQQRDRLKLPNTLLMDQASDGDYDQTIAQVAAGQTVMTEIDRTTVAIAGLFEVGSSFASDGTLIASDQTFLRLFPRRDPGAISLGLLQLQPGSDPAQVKATLLATLPEDVKAFTYDEYIEFEVNEIKANSPISFVFGLGSTMGFVVGVIIVYQVLATDVGAHIGEYATFRAMGYRQGYLLGVVFEEALILSLIGFTPSVGVAMGLYQLTSRATGLLLVMPLARVIGLFIATIVMCALSGAIATRKLRGADPADIF